MHAHSTHTFFSALLMSSALVMLTPVAAWSDTLPPITEIGEPTYNAFAYGINSAGTSVVGETDMGDSDYQAFVWTLANGLERLEELPGADPSCGSTANAISADGTVIVGSAGDSDFDHNAVRWVNGSIEKLVNVSAFPGESYATAVNEDGSMIVGYRNEGGTDEAFLWTTDTELMGALSGLSGVKSYAYAITPDGTYVGGSSDVSGTQKAMRWSSGGGVETLGTIGGATGTSATYALSADGNVATGYSDNGTVNEAFRWESGVGMEGIGSLEVGSASYGQAISADGTIITGMAYVGGDSTAFRWTAATGMESLAEILTEHGVDASDWQLQAATGISADGKMISGYGEIDGVTHAFLMSDTGLTTPEALVASLAPTVEPGPTSMSMMHGSLDMMFTSMVTCYSNAECTGTANFSTQSPPGGGASLGTSRIRYAANDTGTMNDASPAPVSSGIGLALYATGGVNFGKRNDLSTDGLYGTAGTLIGVSKDVTLAVGLVGNGADQDTYLGGETNVDMLGGSLFAAYEPASGLRLYGSATLAAFDVDTKRNYMNGAVVDQSRGSADGTGYALAMRGGYDMALDEQMRVMPYAELEWDKTNIDAYTETGGGIPATVGEQSNDQLVSRLGAELRKAVGNDLTVRGKAAWGHRLSENNGAVVVTALSVTQSLQSASGKDDWAELGVGGNYRVSEAVSLNANVDTRFAGSDDNDVAVTFGLVYRLN